MPPTHISAVSTSRWPRARNVSRSSRHWYRDQIETVSFLQEHSNFFLTGFSSTSFRRPNSMVPRITFSRELAIVGVSITGTVSFFPPCTLSSSPRMRDNTVNNYDDFTIYTYSRKKKHSTINSFHFHLGQHFFFLFGLAGSFALTPDVKTQATSLGISIRSRINTCRHNRTCQIFVLHSGHTPNHAKQTAL